MRSKKKIKKELTEGLVEYIAATFVEDDSTEQWVALKEAWSDIKEELVMGTKEEMDFIIGTRKVS